MLSFFCSIVYVILTIERDRNYYIPTPEMKHREVQGLPKVTQVGKSGAAPESRSDSRTHTDTPPRVRISTRVLSRLTAIFLLIIEAAVPFLPSSSPPFPSLFSSLPSFFHLLNTSFLYTCDLVSAVEADKRTGSCLHRVYSLSDP